MLGYLDALIAALSQRDSTEAERLLVHPLARLLSEEACEEARAFIAGERDALAAPLRTMQLRRQTAELLNEAPQGVAPAVPEAAPKDALEGATNARPSVRPGPRADAPPAPRAALAAPRRRRARPQQMELPLSA